MGKILLTGFLLSGLGVESRQWVSSIRDSLDSTVQINIKILNEQPTSPPSSESHNTSTPANPQLIDLTDQNSQPDAGPEGAARPLSESLAGLRFLDPQRGELLCRGLLVILVQPPVIGFPSGIIR